MGKAETLALELNASIIYLGLISVVAGHLMYQLTVFHRELNRTRVITGRDKYVVEQKAADQLARWNEMWARRVQTEMKQREREEQRQRKEEERQRKQELKESADQQTKEAQQLLEAMKSLLHATLRVDDRVEWERLKDRRAFDKPRPSAESILCPPARAIPPKPNPDSPEFQPKLWFRGYISRSERQWREFVAQQKYQKAHDAWAEHAATLVNANESDVKKWRESVATAIRNWERERSEFQLQQEARNAAIDAVREAYLQGDESAVTDYCEIVLSRSQYPDGFPQEFELSYSAATRQVVVDYMLPNLDAMPTIKEIRYVQSKDEFREAYLTDKQRAEMYDDVVYQIILRTIHELFEADVVNAIDSVALNGWVESIDRRTGQSVRPCIASIVASRGEFLQIDLAHVNPKECFRGLKGIGSAQLSGLAAIAPIVQVNREDKRFVPSMDVLHQINSGVNLAVMDWEEFEHLVREVFEKEFATGGGEVKITRASRDGGVDAIAFDPDPIRGGKIVIQAKRYTRTVGVSAVRDLHGTVQHEGAIKGILVTTADYGPDAYEWAKGKPLTLLNGANLLHLLEKHGRRARIDLSEAIETTRPE